MKVIDLLNKIANGEEVPKKIKYRNKIFIYDKDNKLYIVENYNEYNDLLMELSNHKGTDLNYEVEILEEEKKIPEKLEEFDIQGLEVSGYSMTQAEYLLEDGIKENREMINWILDYLKSKGE